jgi:hypothetical protein
MKPFRKKDFPVSEIRRFLEPGPIVPVSSAWRGKLNIMTMGWHMVMYPETFHYRGDGVFMISGRSLNLSRKFKPEML